MDISKTNLNPMKTPSETVQFTPAQPFQKHGFLKSETQKVLQGEFDPKTLSQKDVERIAEAFFDISDLFKTRLNFSVVNEYDQIIVKIIDKDSGDIVRQFPSEKMLDLRNNMRDLTGFIMNENV